MRGLGKKQFSLTGYAERQNFSAKRPGDSRHSSLDAQSYIYGRIPLSNWQYQQSVRLPYPTGKTAGGLDGPGGSDTIETVAMQLTFDLTRAKIPAFPNLLEELLLDFRSFFFFPLPVQAVLQQYSFVAFDFHEYVTFY